MSARWDDLNARARGLASHLLGLSALRRLAEAGNLAVMAAELDRAGYESGASSKALATEGITAEGIDRIVRRGVSERLAILRRWCRKDDRLTVVFADEDRRSVRSLLRGAVAGSPASSRLAGLVPTPDLPTRALEELARQASPATVAAILILWRHPYGPPLLPEATRSQPDLLRIDLTLNRAFVRIAQAAARRCARALEQYVGQVVDQENAMAALTLAEAGADLAATDCWLEGGQDLRMDAFLAAAAAGTRPEAARILANALPGAPFQEALLRYAEGSWDLEREALQAWIRRLNRNARLSPLGPDVLLGYLLRLRAEAMDLRRIAWGIALGAPAGALEAAAALNAPRAVSVA